MHPLPQPVPSYRRPPLAHVLIASLACLGLDAWADTPALPSLGDLPGAGPAIAAVVKDCDTAQHCVQRFPRVNKFDVESQGSTTFLFSPSSAFSGNAQVYYYREAEFSQDLATATALLDPEQYRQKLADWGHTPQAADIQIQVGFGHLVVAKQRNANLAGTGTVASLPLTLGEESSKLYFQAALLGLATAFTDCSQPGQLTAQQNLACAVPVLPTVDQNSFRSTANTLSDRANLVIADLNAGKGNLCPQILNARVRLWEKSDTPGNALLLPVVSEALVGKSIAKLQQALNQAGSCGGNPLPNLFATYRNDTPIDATLAITDSSIGSKVNRYSISYARRTLATGHKHHADRYLAAWVKSVDDDAKLPSLSFIGTLFSAQLSHDYLNLQLDSRNLPGGTAVLGSKVPATVDGLPNWDSKEFIRVMQAQVNSPSP